jgi:hypothetical protein
MTILYSWKREHFKSIPKDIEKKRAQLEALQEASDEASVAARTGLKKIWMNFYIVKRSCGCNALGLHG